MANLGNIGKHIKKQAEYMQAWSLDWGGNKHGTQVTLTGTSAVAGSFVQLMRNAVPVMRATANGSGVWNFYDLDDSGGQIYIATAYTQSGPTGEMWTVAVSGSTATTTKIFDIDRGSPFVGGG